MTRHPSESYIKYLISLPREEARSDGWVTLFVEQLGFPKPVPDYLDWLRRDITPKIPADFQPTNKYHAPSVTFLKSEKIYGLYNPDQATQSCFTLLSNARARPIVEDLLLGRLDTKEVAKKVNARLSEFFTADVIDSYAHYFWNVSILKVDDWAILLKDVDFYREHTLAITRVGPAMALHKNGFQQHIDSKTVLSEMRDAVHFDFLEWKMQPRSINKTKAMAALAKAAIGLDERLSEADSALKESLAAFERFRMKQSEEGVIDIKEIAPQGNYTGSGAKLLESIAKEEVEVATNG